MNRTVRNISLISALAFCGIWATGSAVGFYATVMPNSPFPTAQDKCMWRYWAATWPVWKVAPVTVAQRFVDWTADQCPKAP